MSIERLIDIVSLHEGTYDSINRNQDGAGVSVGILQWPQRTGGLFLVLNAYYATDPVTFQHIFGPHWHDLLTAAKARSMAPVGGALLWLEPWVSRFRTAGNHPPYQEAQRRLAKESPFTRAAIKIGSILGVTTERAYALAFDTAVNQGPETAVIFARRVIGQFENTTVPPTAILHAYAMESARKYRKVSVPNTPKGAHLKWVEVRPSEWHLYAGNTNLYLSIVKRRTAILNHSKLRDADINLTA